MAPFKIDSFRFPDLSSVARKNMDVDIDVMIRDLLASSNQPNRPYTDTLFFEIFVRDFARNKSNVITTEPLYYLSP
jgi:pullulanase/glycogen debranching enzyme